MHLQDSLLVIIYSTQIYTAQLHSPASEPPLEWPMLEKLPETHEDSWPSEQHQLPCHKGEKMSETKHALNIACCNSWHATYWHFISANRIAITQTGETVLRISHWFIRRTISKKSKERSQATSSYKWHKLWCLQWLVATSSSAKNKI